MKLVTEKVASLQCERAYCDSDVCSSLTRLSSLPFTLQGHGDLLWPVLKK